jgi:hypothetical protein
MIGLGETSLCSFEYFQQAFFNGFFKINILVYFWKPR